jgi:hypothetical protein
MHVSTIFLKAVIYLIGLAILGLCIIIAGVTLSGNAGMYWPVLTGVFLTAFPFFYALYQGIVLLRAIETNTAFTEKSVKAIRTIEYCAFTISAMYAALMPFVVYAAQLDDAPGVVLVALICIFAPLVTGVFAAVLQRLLQNAIDLKSENDLTV